jgi:DamX protein
MKYLHYLLIGAALTCSACTTTPDPREVEAEETLEKARVEFLQKQYESSVITLMPLVREGHPDAQYSVGYMYYYGLGVPRNADFGRQLIQAAAQQGNERAIQAITTFAQQQATLGPSLSKPATPGNELVVNPDSDGPPKFF